MFFSDVVGCGVSVSEWKGCGRASCVLSVCMVGLEGCARMESGIWNLEAGRSRGVGVVGGEGWRIGGVGVRRRMRVGSLCASTS